MRLYGEASTVHPRDRSWSELAALFQDDVGARQIFSFRLELVQTSCGYAVPRYDLRAERPTLTKWAEQKGSEGIEQYWREKNALSLDGKETGIFQDAGK
jgi:hypothetical protein